MPETEPPLLSPDVQLCRQRGTGELTDLHLHATLEPIGVPHLDRRGRSW